MPNGNDIQTLKKIVSGGQTGVDRAALDAAMATGLEVGGWCPKGRRASDGPIPAQYPLTETQGRSYPTRTKWNVRDSDATLIICRDEPTGGTALTIHYCERLGKPYMVYQLRSADGSCLDGEDAGSVAHWLNCHRVKVLNVAGPSEGERLIYAQAHAFLLGLLRWQSGQQEA